MPCVGQKNTFQTIFGKKPNSAYRDMSSYVGWRLLSENLLIQKISVPSDLKSSCAVSPTSVTAEPWHFKTISWIKLYQLDEELCPVRPQQWQCHLSLQCHHQTACLFKTPKYSSTDWKNSTGEHLLTLSTLLYTLEGFSHHQP